MDIVYFLYIVETNKFNKSKKNHSDLTYENLFCWCKTDFGGLQSALSSVAKWSLISALMTWSSETKFCMLVKSKINYNT